MAMQLNCQLELSRDCEHYKIKASHPLLGPNCSAQTVSITQTNHREPSGRVSIPHQPSQAIKIPLRTEAIKDSQSTQYISSCKQSRGGINKNVLQSPYSQVVSYLIAILFYLCLTIDGIFFLRSQELNFC